MAHATIHSIGSYGFDLWEGPPPPLQQNMIRSQTRPGVQNAEHRRLGKNSQEVEVVLTAFRASFADAHAYAANVVQNIVGLNPLIVRWESVDFNAWYGHKYYPKEVNVVRVRQLVRVTGQNFDYVGGAEVVLRLRLIADV